MLHYPLLAACSLQRTALFAACRIFAASCMLRACPSAHRLPHDTCCVHTCSMLHAA
jgi:hypothetical protein